MLAERSSRATTRGFLPVVVDVETAGFNAETDALLEIAAVTLRMDEDGLLRRSQTKHRRKLRVVGLSALGGADCSGEIEILSRQPLRPGEHLRLSAG